MPAAVLSPLFWVAALAIVIGQVFILRSTERAWHASGTPVPFVEKVFAWGPALVLMAVLWFAWQASATPAAPALAPAGPAVSVPL